MRIGGWATTEIVVVAAATCAAAQTSTFLATVPFAFVVGNETLPPGTYIVERLLGKGTGRDTAGVVVVRSEDQQIYKAIITRLDKNYLRRPKSSRLLFTGFQGKQYLDQIWVAGDEAAQRLANVPQESATKGAGRVRQIALVSLH